ncbi:MAG: phosphatidylcholine/phosphatidylserine synthase [Rickettsiales bacterium]|jgi:CDP-diacylglycerol--serine O-phosphatidyltransferase|nr:phosphatidylcholine/phosphatidylserine synthase [Rickettsiales bacterium]
MKTKGNTIGIKIVKAIPNIITMFALCMGLTAVRLAMFDDYRNAVLCIIVSCLLDKIDGGIARKLDVSSDFGAQMDSLADFFDFGIAPGFVIYLWMLRENGFTTPVAWMAVLLLAVCMSIRLARFNVSLVNDDNGQPLNRYFFKGVPAPMAASLVLLPMVLSFEYQNLNIDYGAVMANTILVAIMAGSKIPTPCFKKVDFGPILGRLSSLGVWIFLFGLVVKTWITATLICVLYIITIFISWGFYYKFYRDSLTR